MASIIRSLGNQPIRSLLLRSARSSRLLPVALSPVPKLSYSTAPADSQSEGRPDLVQLLAGSQALLVKQLEETQAAREDIRTAQKDTRTAREETRTAREEAHTAQEKIQTLLTERADLVRDMTNLQRDALNAADENLRVKRNFNVRGALERIAYAACLQNKITPKPKDGVQVKLNAIVQLPEFQTALQDVVAKRKLVQKDVMTCIRSIYHEVSKHAHGNQQPITLSLKEFTQNELAAVMAFLRVQDQWPKPLKWEVEEEEEEGTERKGKESGKRTE